MAGGQVGKWISSDEVVSYDPAANRWTTLGKLPDALQGPIVQQVGNKVIVSGGNTGSNILTRNTWIGTLK
jgi:N-acetylneuraminic acid mutarotase